jgi:lipopolysaccharide export system protein LptA
MKLARIYIFIFSIFFSYYSLAFTQNESSEKLNIINADTTRYSKTPQGTLIELIGNVHLQQGKSEMFCGRAEHWKDAHKTIVHDNVRIYDENKILFADQVFYFDISQVFKATGNVLLKDSIRQITAEQVSYLKNEDRIKAEKNVVMNDSINYIIILGEFAEFDNARDYALITGDPILMRKDSTGKEELRITSIKMELFEGGDKAVVTDSVRIIQSKANATCGLAEFYRKNNEILLKKKPVAWQGGDRLSGELIHLYVEKNKLVKAIVKDLAVVTSRVDTTDVEDQRENILTGQQITMYFENEQLYRVEVENKATSYYYIYEDDEEKGMNKIIGDKISVYITKRRIERIVVESNPQLSSGTYYPPGKETEQEIRKIK